MMKNGGGKENTSIKEGLVETSVFCLFVLLLYDEWEGISLP